MLWRRRPDKDPALRRHKPKCSFCGKQQGEQGGNGKVRMVAGPGVFICSECIVSANEILRGDNSPAPA